MTAAFVTSKRYFQVTRFESVPKHFAVHNRKYFRNHMLKNDLRKIVLSPPGSERDGPALKSQAGGCILHDASPGGGDPSGVDSLTLRADRGPATKSNAERDSNLIAVGGMGRP